MRRFLLIVVSILLPLHAVVPAQEPAPPASTGVVPQWVRSSGQVAVWAQLADPPLAASAAAARNGGLGQSGGGQRAYLDQLRSKHDSLSATAAALGARELGRVTNAHNAVAFSIDRSALPILASQPGVVAVRPVLDYSIDLSQTVPYIGATAVQNLGVTGRGVRVAVLDTGIDYTHRNLEGSGTAADYTAAFGTSLSDSRNKTVNPALFPTSKVVGGYDFVGEQWPNGPLAPDPNPIDCGGVGGCTGMHGTHVADIIGGHSTDGTHKGVAPGAQLYAVKVCSSVSSACSGIALLEGIDFALDPNGDGDLSDAVDVINMSLGSSYGQVEDDLALASENAVRLGVVVVAAAGNAGDKPYIVSSPSTGPGVISVAQTQVPSSMFYPLIINSPADIAGTYNDTATVDWAPVGTGFVGKDVVFVGAACTSLAANPAGKVALAIRGSCSVSLKVDRAIAAGAVGVLVMMADASEPISFSYGGGTHFGPTLIILKSYGDLTRSVPVANVTVHDSQPLVKSMVGTSARGPSYSYQTVKPEIGAPGASVSAIAGSGTAQSAFGGTSGATPMIAGSATLLREAYPHASPMEIKARLMNNTETAIQTAPAVLGSELAPVSRIGAGEVRVDRALNARTAAWVEEDESAAVSFGYAALGRRQEFHKQIVVTNFSDHPRSYRISMDFRDPINPATAAVTMKLPASITVSAHHRREFDVQMKVDPQKLSTWALNGGQLGGSGSGLTALELDGHITIADSTDAVRLPWHLLPHKAADVRARDEFGLDATGTGFVPLSNRGAVAGRVEVFAWTGTGKKIPRRLLPRPGDNFAVINLGQVGVRTINAGGTPAVQFGINTFGRRSHPNYPAEFDIVIDANRDGTPDYIVFNAENGGLGASGQNVTWVLNLQTNTSTPVFFTDADLNSANVIMTAPLAAVGLTPSSQFDFSIYAFDNYFTGNLTDAIKGMTFSLALPRFTAAGVPVTGVPVGGRSSLEVHAVPGGDAASPSQVGLLLLYRDAANVEAQTIRPGESDEEEEGDGSGQHRE